MFVAREPDATRRTLRQPSSVRTRKVCRHRPIALAFAALGCETSTGPKDGGRGQVLWRIRSPRPRAAGTAPQDAQPAAAESAVDDVALHVGTRSHKVYALDVRTGSPLWTADIGPALTYPGFVEGISVSGDTVYVAGTRDLNQFGGLSAGVIAALDRRDGHMLWMYQGPGNGKFAVTSPLRSLIVFSAVVTTAGLV